VYPYDTFLILPSKKKDSEGSDKERERERETKKKKPRGEKLTYNHSTRISTNINIRWHLS